MAIPSEVERLDTGDIEGCKYRGYIREVITGEENTITPFLLKASQSGALVIQGSATGSYFILPPAEDGLWFEFGATVSVVASDTYKVECTSGDFIKGVVVIGNLTEAASGDVFTANGTTHIGIESNGTTTGGLIGDSFVLTAISGTIWALTRAVMQGSGTCATPFYTV